MDEVGPVPAPSETMRAVIVSKYINEDGELEKDAVRLVAGKTLKPSLQSLTGQWRRPLRRRRVLVKVLSCSLSRRDALAMTGSVAAIRPRIPYVPGTDICGIIEEIGAGVRDFMIGDIVVGNTGRVPMGGLAEYAVVDADRITLKPEKVDHLSAAACSSAGAAAVYAMDYVYGGNRVLILGGGGGVGGCCVQLARIKGASYIAATSRQRTLVKRLGADTVVNYMREDWWEKEEFVKDPFDVIIDCVGDLGSFDLSANVLKMGHGAGRFVDIAGDSSRLPDVSDWFRGLRSRRPRPNPLALCGSLLPRYRRIETTRLGDEIAMVLRLLRDEKLVIVLHNAGSFPFTTYGVQDAFRVIGSGNAHGKVVVAVCTDPFF